MATHYKPRRVLFYVTGAVALLASLITAVFALIAGAGWLYLDPAMMAIVLLTLGLATSIWKQTIGSWVTAAGASFCAVALLMIMWDLALAIPFKRQPGQSVMLAPPLFFLLLLTAHVNVSVQQIRSLQTDEVTPWPQ